MMSARITRTILALPFLGALACGSESTTAGDVLVVASVEISPPELTLVAGSTGQLTATPRTSSGISVPNRPVAWSSDDPGIASVSNEGIVTGVASGTTRINARIDGVSASVPLDVSPKPVETVTVAPSQFTLRVGESQDLTVTARSQDGETLTGRPATFASDNPEIATVSDAGQVTAVSPGLTVITATVEGKSGTANVAVDALPASQLEFQNQPATSAAGAPIPPVRVEVQNNQGGTVSEGSAAVTIALDANPTGAALSGTLTVGAVNGVATFSDLRVNLAGTGYTLRATSGTLTPAESAPFAIVPGSAARLTIVTQPSPTATSGAEFTIQPRIQIRDPAGNDVAESGVTVTAVLEGSGATLQGDRTATTNAQGLATFSDLTLSGLAGTYSLLFAAPGLTAVASNEIVLSAGAAAGLALIRQPSPTAEAGVVISRQPVVQLVDAHGNPVSQSGVAVSVAIQTGGGVLEGNLTVLTNSGGQSAFQDLAIGGLTGTRVLRFSAGALPPVVSEEVVLLPGEADGLSLTTQPPATSQSGTALSPAPAVRVVDRYGNPVDPDAEITVSATIATGSGGTLGGMTTVTTTGGVAVFSDLVLSGPSGAYTLRFSSGVLTSVVSSTIILGEGEPAELFIATQPSTTAESGVPLERQPVIQLRDGSGNDVSSSGVEVTAAVASGGGSLGGTLTRATDSNGRATFTDLVITGTPGEYTLRFSATGLTGVTSAPIEVVAAAVAEPSALVLATAPSSSATSGTPLATQPAVQLVDAEGDPVAWEGATITAVIASGPEGASLSNATATTNANGRAAFSGLAITGVVGSYTIRFQSGSLDPVTSPGISLSAGTPAAISIVTQPPDAATSGAQFSSVVEVTDGAGNGVAGLEVTATLASGDGELQGTLKRDTDGTGRAAFDDLVLTGDAGSYTIEFSTAGGLSVVSRTITLSSASSGAIVMVTQPPPTARDDRRLDPDPRVGLQDGSGNPLRRSSVPISVSLVIESGTGQLKGETVRTTNNEGRATFNGLRIDGRGTFRLRFVSPSYSSVDSSGITVER